MYIADPDRKLVYGVVDSKRLVVAAAIAPTETLVRDPRLSKTGRFDVVAGQRCEILIGRYKSGDTAEMCVSTLPFYAGILGLGEDIGGFPFRAVMRDASGAVKFRLQVMSVEERPIDDSRFEPPAGYARVTAPAD